MGPDGIAAIEGKGPRKARPPAVARSTSVRRAKARPARRPEAAPESRLEGRRRQADILVHDFNNLLNVILAANEALAMTLPQDSDGYELARIGQEAAEKGAELLKRMAELARSDDDQPALAVDAAEVSVATARLAQVSTPAAVTVVALAMPEPLACRADRGGLESALLNLCVNAGHALPNGGAVQIATTSRRLAGDQAAGLGLAPGAYVAFSVIDTGVGMSADVLARATEPYFTTRAGRGGTGLGLAGVRDFARRAGGALKLASELGRGTTATIYLPRA